MTPERALMLESFKKRNTAQIDAWSLKWPELRHTPPIYWDLVGQCWKWSPIHQKDIAQYRTLCQSVLKRRRGPDVSK